LEKSMHFGNPVTLATSFFADYAAFFDTAGTAGTAGFGDAYLLGRDRGVAFLSFEIVLPQRGKKLRI
jgi:hypothetical protein